MSRPSCRLSLWMLALAAHVAAVPVARGATLDAAPSGDDIVFTFDTGLPATILRGPTPDALVPWMFAGASPFVAVGENLTRGENAFYRLDSGSNMAFRTELDINWPLAPPRYAPLTLSLPERRSYDARDLFAMWPGLVDLFWWDGAQRRYESLARFPEGVLGDDDPLPRHGGVYAVFFGTGAITIVGSHDETYAGPDGGDLQAEVSFPNDSRVRPIGVPPHVRDRGQFSIICGQLGADWFDVDGDGMPDDQCGIDRDGDGFTDSGLYRNCEPPGPSCGRFIYVRTDLLDAGGSASVQWAAGQQRFSGLQYDIPPGAGMLVQFRHFPDTLPASEMLNLPWRLPTW